MPRGCVRWVKMVALTSRRHVAGGGVDWTVASLRIPMKADSCSNSYRTGIPIDVGQLSERSDARG
jgi:hypothetical protein